MTHERSDAPAAPRPARAGRSSEALRVLVVLGTRPEAIKLAPVIKELGRRPEIATTVCATEQHKELVDQVLEVFSIEPDVRLGVMTAAQSLDRVTARILEGLGDVLERVKPLFTIVQGDTSTSFAGALASFHRRIPVGHVEAGLRTGSLLTPWPEEMYRRFVDSIAALLWAPTRRAEAALLREGAPRENVFLTGNTVVDALRRSVALIDEDPATRRRVDVALAFLDPDKRIVLVTGHRRESFEGGLAEVCSALNRLADRDDVQVVWPVHPNPTVRRTVAARLRARASLHVGPPLDYLAFVELMRRSCLIITDSGGIQEEAPTFGKPVLVTRTQTERPEAVEAGAAEVVGTSESVLLAAAERLLDDRAHYEARSRITSPFGDGAAARRIVETLVARAAARSGSA